MARNNNLMFFETSAKSGENVKNIFEELVKNIMEQKNFYKLENFENKDKTGFSVNKTGDKIKENECSC